MVYTYNVITAWVLSFFIYAVAGWVWESIVCPILTGRAIHNSGFLIGPWVPIYGAGAIAVNLLFSPHEKVYSIFLEGAVVACVIEYLTSWAMEKIYHRRWWDYSHMRFHLNGRVCLAGFLVFGLFSVISVCLIQPDLIAALRQHDWIQMIIFTTVIATLFATDFTVTVIHMAHLQERLDDLAVQLKKEAEKLRVEVEGGRFDVRNLQALIAARRHQQVLPSVRIKYIESRLLRSFPELLNKRNHDD